MLQLFRKKHSVNQEDNGDMTKDNEVFERLPKELSKEIDAMFSVSQAKLNFFHRLSELKRELGIDDDSQILTIEK